MRWLVAVLACVSLGGCTALEASCTTLASGCTCTLSTSPAGGSGSCSATTWRGGICCGPIDWPSASSGSRCTCYTRGCYLTKEGCSCQLASDGSSLPEPSCGAGHRYCCQVGPTKCYCGPNACASTERQVAVCNAESVSCVTTEVVHSSCR